MSVLEMEKEQPYQFIIQNRWYIYFKSISQSTNRICWGRRKKIVAAKLEYAEVCTPSTTADLLSMTYNALSFF